MIAAILSYLVVVVGHSHALAASASRGLHHHGVADLLRVKDGSLQGRDERERDSK
jgi:hypothetical protein